MQTEEFDESLCENVGKFTEQDYEDFIESNKMFNNICYIKKGTNLTMACKMTGWSHRGSVGIALPYRIEEKQIITKSFLRVKLLTEEKGIFKVLWYNPDDMMSYEFFVPAEQLVYTENNRKDLGYSKKDRITDFKEMLNND